MFPFFGALQSASSWRSRSSPDSADQKKDSEYQELAGCIKDVALDPVRWICALSHISLVALLASFMSGRPDKFGFILFSRPGLAITDDETDIIGLLLQKGVSKAYGWIITGWTIILTYTMQKLALRRQLSLYTSLTATHDANESWMGMGSAILGLLNCRQHNPRAALNSIFFPLAYLGGIACLHSVAIGMFTLVTTPVNTTVTFNSSGIPDFSGNAVRNILTGSSALLTMLSLDDL
ncbi:hypothetical protein GYMLUDRAFT_785185 [Collybiopsis luxurians FD-317 M1]|nr:hypothetical protein GYMLUDRAFT_785185 [Collybiopsis luxurians FD-317 M1]